MGPDPAPLMSAPELTLRTSGITWRTEGYGGPDNDVRLSALGELCVDVQRLARSTLVKISASDSPASSSTSAAPKSLPGGTRGSQQHPPRNDRPPHRLGKTLPWRSSWVPAFLAGPAPSRARRPRSTPARMVVVGRSCRTTDDILWGGCRPGRQVSADPYSGSMRRTNCGSQTRSWMTPSSRGAVVRRYFSSSGVAFASTQGTARRMWR
jgi:hypothetical protein